MASGQDKVTGGIVIIGGIFIMTVLAGLNDNLGRILLIIMLGFVLLWLMSGGYGYLEKWMGKVPGTSIGNAAHAV
jgi:hypothetical protein